MTRVLKLSFLIALLAACAPSATERPAPQPSEPGAAVEPGPFSVIMLIGDGTGLNHWSAARLAFGNAAVEQFPVVGLVGTQAADRRITDSAAGATAFAAGVKTYNGAIGVGPDTQAVRTVLERAQRQGKATGLVSTSSITHATPASFAAHVPSRTMYFQIATQMAGAGVDVMLGGGRAYFHPAVRPDSADLIARMERRATVADSAAELTALDLSRVDRLVGFIADDQPPAAARRTPTLATMTGMALELLERDDDGFFLMVEGSQIDWRGHDNAPLQDVLAELQDLDGAIRAALAFQERRPNTLIIVTADHETGGFALHYDKMGVFRAHYTTDGHTYGMVPLFAIGPGSAALGGIKENDEIGRLLMGLIREDGPVATP